MSLLTRVFPWIGTKEKSPVPSEPTSNVDTRVPNEPSPLSSERGRRTTPENQLKYLYRIMWVDPDVRQAILDVREMDRLDGRVKRIHGRVARDVIKGGLVMTQASDNKTLGREWDRFQRRLQLNRVEKLKSDARGLVMEGNLPMQWVLDDRLNVCEGVRMASETILPDVDQSGRFKDVRKAYIQLDVMTGAELASFPLWQLLLARFDPDNFDDLGAMGRPFIDASRGTWQKLRMTDEDLVIRRRQRAPLRMAHVLEGASVDDLATYRKSIEADQNEITTDYYLNKKGGVTAVQGDTNLDHIKDVTYLLDSFFAGTPVPKGLMGYTEHLARDILEDLKRDYYDEIDVIQDTLSFTYESGFRLQLMLKGINPDANDFTIKYAERRTETANQTADRALKWQALGIPQGMIHEEMGMDPSYVQERRAFEAKTYDPYPDPHAIGPPGRSNVSITPGNAPKQESATSISNN